MMSRPTRDRTPFFAIVISLATALLAVGFLGNALFMLSAPLSWYQGVAGVSHTGPFNPHFVRDIGLAYLTLAALGFYALWRPQAAPACLGTITLYLALHAGLHLWDIAAVRLPLDHLWVDLPGVFFPPLLTAALAWAAIRKEHIHA